MDGQAGKFLSTPVTGKLRRGDAEKYAEKKKQVKT
jgi:hypothetical protein